MALPAAGTLAAPDLFRSFWMGGFECSTHRNHLDLRLDMTAGVQHDAQAESDYRLLPTMGILTARDGLRWHLIERERGRYDWTSFAPMMQAAQRAGVQTVWDLCHYGWPDYLDLLAADFPERFARFAEAAAGVVRSLSDEVPFYAPVNEISFFAWASARGLMFPHAEGKDFEIKRQLVRAATQAIEAIRAVDRRARFVFPEPTIHVLPQPDRPGTEEAARRYSESQFEAWDMIGGYMAPELGGRPENLDILGANFYATNEWNVDDGRRLGWDREPRDPRWRPLHLLLSDIWNRYRRPLFLAETSHIGVGRAPWITEIASEILLARQAGIPLQGLCLYPILDRYDWGNVEHWHNSGLWNLSKSGSGVLKRELDMPYAAAVKAAQQKLAAIGCN